MGGSGKTLGRVIVGGEWEVGLMPTAYFLRPRHGVRHIIAKRDEARPHAGADGRDAHPYLARMGFAGG